MYDVIGMPQETKPAPKRAKKKAVAKKAVAKKAVAKKAVAKKAVKTPKTPKKTCSNCAYFKQVGDSVIISKCRRYPKPCSVSPGHWCGEHKEGN